MSGVKVPYPGAPYGPGSGPGPALLFTNPPPLQDCNDSLVGKMGFSDWSAPYDSTQGGSRLPNHHTAAPSGTSPSPSSSSDGEEQNDTSTKWVVCQDCQQLVISALQWWMMHRSRYQSYAIAHTPKNTCTHTRTHNLHVFHLSLLSMLD